MSEPRVHVILTTVGSAADAERLATLWVDTHRAACVSVLPGVTSTYRWEGELRTEAECLLLIKTASRDEADLDARLAAFAADHPYDEPELLVLDPGAGAAGYLAWVCSEVG